MERRSHQQGLIHWCHPASLLRPRRAPTVLHDLRCATFPRPPEISTKVAQPSRRLTLVALLVVVSATLLTVTEPPLFGGLLAIAGLVVIGYRTALRSRERRMLMQLEFHLPVVMERVAMAVQSGLDVHPALRLAHRIATETSETQGAADPVSVLLDEACNLAEAGRTLKEALLEIGGRSPSSSIRHAFMHLALACEEGGELSLPLQELSDATQRRYQETVEEMIAKLPVKATAPLVCTFAGLLLTFITPPVLRVAGLSKKIPPPPPPITIEHKEGR